MRPSYLYLNCYVIRESGYHSCSLKSVSTEYEYKIPMWIVLVSFLLCFCLKSHLMTSVFYFLPWEISSHYLITSDSNTIMSSCPRCGTGNFMGGRSLTMHILLNIEEVLLFWAMLQPVYCNLNTVMNRWWMIQCLQPSNNKWGILILSLLMYLFLWQTHYMACHLCYICLQLKMN